MTATELLRNLLTQRQEWLHGRILADRSAAILALVDYLDRQPPEPDPSASHELLPWRADSLGAELAFALCLEPSGSNSYLEPGMDTGDLAAWAQSFLAECRAIAEVELLLTPAESGALRLETHEPDEIHAWLVTRQLPPSWRERADFNWWAAWHGRKHPDQETDPIAQQRSTVAQRQVYRLDYPDSVTIGGCTIANYRQIITWLREEALPHASTGPVRVWSRAALIESIAAGRRIPPSEVALALGAITLSGENAAYHAAVSGVTLPPLIELEPDRLALLRRGLFREPELYLARELRRRFTQEYHNVAFHRERVFRDDLYRRFADRRFVTSPERIKLRRTGGDVRTDIDAAIFDRKSGTLALFELKSQDPFATTAAERDRQQQNLRFAFRQMSSVLDWLNRHGPDEILNRFDSRTARRFKVQKVCCFVLGRFLAPQLPDNAANRRVATGSWPHLLRILDQQQTRPAEGNPLASLFNRLTNDREELTFSSQTLCLESTSITLHPNYAAYQRASLNRPD